MLFLFQAGFISLDGGFKAKVQGVTDQRMTDGHFAQVRHMLLEELQILQVQVMACIHTQAHAVGGGSSSGKRCYGSLWIIASFIVLGKWASV